MAAVALNMTIPVIVKNNGEVRGGNKIEQEDSFITEFRQDKKLLIKNFFCRVSKAKFP